jgi:hypothetical protein
VRVSGSTKLVMVGLMLVLAIGSTAWFASGDESSSEASGHAIGPNGTGVGRTLSFQLDIGKDVTDAQLQEAYAILDRIHVAPSKHA